MCMLFAELTVMQLLLHDVDVPASEKPQRAASLIALSLV
jgi:hypothetical protein